MESERASELILKSVFYSGTRVELASRELAAENCWFSVHSKQSLGQIFLMKRKFM